MSKASHAGKVTASHSTMTEAAAEVANHAHKLTQVTKISLGEIRHVNGGRRDIKFQPILAGIKAKVRGTGAIQELYIYTNKPEEVARILTEEFRT